MNGFTAGDAVRCGSASHRPPGGRRHAQRRPARRRTCWRDMPPSTSIRSSWARCPTASSWSRAISGSTRSRATTGGGLPSAVWLGAGRSGCCNEQRRGEALAVAEADVAALAVLLRCAPCSALRRAAFRGLASSLPSLVACFRASPSLPAFIAQRALLDDLFETSCPCRRRLRPAGSTSRCRACPARGCLRSRRSLFTLSGANSVMSIAPAQSSRCLISSQLAAVAAHDGRLRCARAPTSPSACSRRA